MSTHSHPTDALPSPDPAPATGLDEAALHALTHFLESPALGGRAMDVHMIQGLAAGLALGPQTISAELWLPWVWDHVHGCQPPAVTDQPAFNAGTAGVMALYHEAAERLGPAAADNPPPYTPLFAGLGEADQEQAVADFCAGWRRAIALAGLGAWVPMWAESPQWLDVIGVADPSANAVLALLAPMRRFRLAHPGPAEPLDAQAVLAELQAAFGVFRRPFPREAVALAERHRSVVAPWLVQVLEDLARDPSLSGDDGDDTLYNFAMLLLGHWRDTRAYRPLLALARLPYDTIDRVLGDGLFETYDRAVAGVCDGDLAPLAALVEDESINAWVRGSLLEAWALLVIEGDAPAAPLEDCLLALGERDAAWLPDRATQAPPYDGLPLIDAVVHVAANLCSERLRVPVLGWFDAGLIDPSRIGRDEFVVALNGSMAAQREQLRAQGRSYLRDAETETRWWSGYQEDHEDHEDRERPPASQPLPPGQRSPWPGLVEPVMQPIVRESPKVGRNDPCPCGSGRKYKKCHGAG